MCNSDAPAKARGVDGSIPQPEQLVVCLEHRHRAARHVERGDVVAHQVAGDLHARLLEQLGDLAVHQVQLDERRAAHAVEHHDRRTRREVEVGENRLDQLLGDLVRLGERHAVASRLTVDAHADLHHVLGQVEGRLAGRGHRAAGERHAHRAAGVVDLVGEGDDRREVAALFLQLTVTEGEPPTMEALGDKISSKDLAQQAGASHYDHFSHEPSLASLSFFFTIWSLFAALKQTPLPPANNSPAILLSSNGHVAQLGIDLFTDHLIAVELAGTILLVALVAAVCIAMPTADDKPADNE